MVPLPISWMSISCSSSTSTILKFERLNRKGVGWQIATFWWQLKQLNKYLFTAEALKRRHLCLSVIFALLWEWQNLGNGILLIIVLSDVFNGCALCILKYAIKTVSRSKIWSLAFVLQIGGHPKRRWKIGMAIWYLDVLWSFCLDYHVTYDTLFCHLLSNF